MNDYLKLLKILCAAQVRFVVIGGAAAAAQDRPTPRMISIFATIEAATTSIGLLKRWSHSIRVCAVSRTTCRFVLTR